MAQACPRRQNRQLQEPSPTPRATSIGSLAGIRELAWWAGCWQWVLERPARRPGKEWLTQPKPGFNHDGRRKEARLGSPRGEPAGLARPTGREGQGWAHA